MSLEIRISNLNKRRRISHKAVEKAARYVLGKHRVTDALIDITFVSNRKISALNKKHMKRKTPTDVLSFLLEEKLPRRKKGPVGDIYISSDIAHSNAKRFKTPYRKELLLYVIHGLLHLLGFGDKTAKEKKRIHELERRFVKELWQDRGLSKV